LSEQDLTIVDLLRLNVSHLPIGHHELLGLRRLLELHGLGPSHHRLTILALELSHAGLGLRALAGHVDLPRHGALDHRWGHDVGLLGLSRLTWLQLLQSS
jgi:hypothetical protein